MPANRSATNVLGISCGPPRVGILVRSFSLSSNRSAALCGQFHLEHPTDISPISTLAARQKSMRQRFTLELDIALLGDRSLFDRNHLSFHLSQLGRGLLVTAHKKRRGPENNHCRRRSPLIFGALAVLHAR